MSHDFGQVLWVHGIQDVEEIISRRALIFWIDARKVLSKLDVLLEIGPEAADRKLIVLWHLDLLDLLLLEELLLAGQYFLEEILVDGGLVGQIELD